MELLLCVVEAIARLRLLAEAEADPVGRVGMPAGSLQGGEDAHEAVRGAGDAMQEERWSPIHISAFVSNLPADRRV